MLRRVLVAAGAALCLLPATASASNSNPVVQDCSDHGKLTKRYTQKQYRDALADMPTDLDEYSDCRDVIEKARLAAAAAATKKSSSDDDSKKGGGSGKSGGGKGGTPATSTQSPAQDDSTPPASSSDAYDTATPEAQTQAKQEARKVADSTPTRHRIDNVDVDPGSLAYHDFSSVSKLPIPLVALAGLILLSVLVAAGYLIASRVRTGRPRT